MDQTNVIDILKLVWPLAVIQLVVEIYAIVDLARRWKTKNLSPIVWLILILFVNLIGAVLYLIIGRSDEE
jgi:hypothetical protein